MEKYIHIQDIRNKPCYANVNARLIYLHVACQVDTSTYTCAKSLRQLARELDMTVATVRHAIKQLENEGLITTSIATHTAAHNGTQLTTQLTTHITILRTNQKRPPKRPPSDTPSSTPNDTPSSTQNNIINAEGTKKAFTHTDAREKVGKSLELLRREFNFTDEQAERAVAVFMQRQQLKGKAWESEGDYMAHLLNFTEKRRAAEMAEEARRRRTPATDTQARQQERERALQQQQAESAAIRQRDELNKLRRWQNEARQRGDLKQAELLQNEITKMERK